MRGGLRCLFMSLSATDATSCLKSSFTVHPLQADGKSPAVRNATAITFVRFSQSLECQYVVAIAHPHRRPAAALQAALPARPQAAPHATNL